MDSVFKALADQNRRKILDRLKQKDMSVSELLQQFNMAIIPPRQVGAPT